MYRPDDFRIDDPETLYALIRENPFATLVSMGADGLTASHLPLILNTNDSTSIRLEGHFARANSHWRELEFAKEVLAIFQGPAGYITPSWYASKREHGKVVPTWNYAIIHTHCTPKIMDDRDWLVRHVSQLTDQQEDGVSQPWSVDDAPEGYISALSRGIVGVELQVSRLEGKWKMSQNRPEKDRDGVVSGLRGLGSDAAQNLADLVENANGDEKPSK